MFNTYVASGYPTPDRAKRNTGGLDSDATLIKQGDLPVNIEDIEEHYALQAEMRAEVPEMFDGGGRYVQPTDEGGNIREGVSLTRSMYDNEMIRKNSDY